MSVFTKRFVKVGLGSLFVSYFLNQKFSESFLGFFESKEEEVESYQWGNGHYQARPEEILQFKNFFPHKILGHSRKTKF